MSVSFKPYASDAGIALSMYCHDEIMVPISYDDAEKLVSNLLSNTIKYSGFDNSVVINVSQQDHIATVTVIDTGIGIAKEHIDKIFTRFYRVNAEQTETIEGSGIGLSIVKRIVENASGKIDVISELGAGTTFTIELPLCKSVQIYQRRSSDKVTIQPKVKETELINNVNKPRLLLIEDNDDILIYLSSLLSNNYKITTAINGEEDIQQARDIIPDIIISDVMMPGIDGLRLRADDYIAKPFDEDELPLRLRNLLEARDMIKQKFIVEYMN